MSQLVLVQQCLPLDAGRPAALVSRLVGQLLGRRWSIVRLRSERKWGELLPETVQGKRNDLELRSGGTKLTEAERMAAIKARQVFAIPPEAFDTYLAEADEPTRSELLRTGKQGKLPAGQLLGPAMTPQEAGALSRSKGSTGAEYLAQNRARQVAA